MYGPHGNWTGSTGQRTMSVCESESCVESLYVTSARYYLIYGYVAQAMWVKCSLHKYHVFMAVLVFPAITI